MTHNVHSSGDIDETLKRAQYKRGTIDLPAQINTTYHLFVLKGHAKLISGPEDKTRHSGEAITCSAKEQVRIENSATTELSLIQIELKNPGDK
jgi:mannose-6-phosphate isomerase-like protein (cupin superfamily)